MLRKVKHILVTVPVEQRHIDLLKAAVPEAEFRFREFMEKEDVAPEDVAWAEVILGNVEPGQLNASEKLRWLQTGKYRAHQCHRRLWAGNFRAYAGHAFGNYQEAGALP